MSYTFTAANAEAIDLGIVPNLPGTNDQLFIDAWVFRGASADQRVIDKSTATVAAIDWNLGIGGTDRVKFVVNNTTLEVGGVVKANRWCHIAGDYDGVTMATFMNGVLQGTVAKIGNVPNSVRPVRLGSTGFNPALRNFQGAMYRIRVFNRSFRTQAGLISSIFETDGADTEVDELFYEWKGTEGPPSTDIGAGVVVNSGPQPLVNGSGEGAGASLPSWGDQDLRVYQGAA